MKIILIGTGRMGFAQARIARFFNDEILLAIDSNPGALKEFSDTFQIRCTSTFDDLPQLHADLIWLTVNDDAIEHVAETISGTLHPDTVILHTSGALSSKIIKKHTNNPCGSFHPLAPCPLKQITDAECVSLYRGVMHAFEGDSKAHEIVVQLSERLNSPCIALPSDAKPLYHASAVIASNYPLILINMATELLVECGFSRDQALEATKRLCQQSLKVLDHAQPLDALTGPIKRNALETIQTHESVLKSYPQALAVYSAIKEAAFEMLKK